MKSQEAVVKDDHLKMLHEGEDIGKGRSELSFLRLTSKKRGLGKGLQGGVGELSHLLRLKALL